MVNSNVAGIFNDMEADYDDLQDLWYAWLFSRLHYIIAKKIIQPKGVEGKKVLDIGCGTGFQSLLYANYGARVTGIDISDRLIAVAKSKASHLNVSEIPELFSAHFPFVDRYNKKTGALLKSLIPENHIITPPEFLVADAIELPIEDNTYDIVNCCGSTLSFIPDYSRSLLEINRVLKPGGTFILETEAKWNPDLVWTWLDSWMFFGKLDFETGFREASKQLFGQYGKHILVEYPFGETRSPVYMNIRLFSRRRLFREMKKAGLQITGYKSIHSVTNCIPSTKLDTAKPGKGLKRVFNFFAGIEQRLPFYTPGCSLVIYGKKS